MRLLLPVFSEKISFICKNQFLHSSGKIIGADGDRKAIHALQFPITRKGNKHKVFFSI